MSEKADDRRDWLWCAAIVGYFIAQMVSRLLIGPALDLDEAEAFYFARELAFGYGPQPPLYFWLQWVFFAVLGENIFALAALKALILGGGCVMIYRFLRAVLPPEGAGLATVSLGLLPELVWEAQRTLTHTNLVFLMSVLTFWAMRRVLVRQGTLDYVIFGIVVGLGLLAKHNFVVFLLAILAVVAVFSRWRLRLSWRGLAVSGAVAAALALPYALWLLQNPEIGTGSLSKLGVQPDAAGALFAAATALIVAFLSLYGLAVVVLIPLILRHRATLRRAWPDELALLAATALVAMMIVTAMILVSGATSVKSRWLMPLGWSLLPAVVGAVCLAAGGMRPGWRRGLLWGLPAVWAVVLVALPYASLENPGYRAARFDRVVAAIPADVPVVSADIWALGNLALLLPSRPIYRSGSVLPSGPVAILAQAGGAEDLGRTLGLQDLGVPKEVVVMDGRRGRIYDLVSGQRAPE